MPHRPLKIAVLAHEASNTVEHELIPAARARGHHCERVDLGTVRLDRCFEASLIGELATYDVVYYRTSFGDVGAFTLLKHLRMQNVFLVNDAYIEHPFMAHKFYQTILAGHAGVPVAKTYTCDPPEYAHLRAALHLPFIVKADVSSQGRDVHRVEDEATFEALPGRVTNGAYMFQEYIEHPYDVRVHVVGREPVAAYRRVPAAGDFRTNVSRGGAMVPVSKQERSVVYDLARRTNDVFECDIGAIDFLKRADSDSYVFSEINCNPGWEASDAHATGVDMTGLVLDFFEAHATL